MPETQFLTTVFHPINWYGGWALVLAGFFAGALVGLRFHEEMFWGGYASFRRRIVRLGHVALVALGVVNVVFSVSVRPTGSLAAAASICLLAGAIAMPVVCFLTGWRKSFRQLFPVPVALLMTAIILILLGGLP